MLHQGPIPRHLLEVLQANLCQSNADKVSWTLVVSFGKGIAVLLRPEKFLFNVSEVTERTDYFAQIWAELN